MIQINLHEAQTRLTELIERVQGGEEFTITKAGKPIARLCSVAPAPKGIRFGLLAGRLQFDDEEFKSADAEIERLFLQSDALE
jgi:prevent-host-death family protein